jgi:hypothetical protein
VSGHRRAVPHIAHTDVRAAPRSDLGTRLAHSHAAIRAGVCKLVGTENQARRAAVARHDVGVIWARKIRQVPQPATEPLVGVVGDAASASRGGEALDRLIERLADLDAAGDIEQCRSALAVVCEVPQVVLWLDEHARRAQWQPWRYRPAVGKFAARFDELRAGPVAVALASMHRDGRVRERAVAAMLAAPCAEVVPFLIVRTGDWVAQVRDRARAGLAVLLAEDPDRYLPAALPTALLVKQRYRGGFACGQVLAALLIAPVQLRGRLASVTSQLVRRLVFDVGLGQGWWGLDELVAAAETDLDVRIRSRAAQAACREAVWTCRVRTLRRLAGNTRAEVRVVALTGLARAGYLDEVAACLDDDAPLVRALARDAARRVGIEALVHYRAAVVEDVPALGAIAGLAEIGPASDALLLRPLLGHPDAKIRAQTLRAMRNMDAVSVEQTLALLRDVSSSVVREASAALRPFSRSLPPTLGWDLLAAPRPELRRAGYRLLHDQPTHVLLRAALIAATDADPGLARRGYADATRLARDARQSVWRRSAVPELPLSSAERAALMNLTRKAASVLGENTTSLLTKWLSEDQTK